MTKESLPIITTIIPTYQRPNLLKRAVTSVLRQTYPHFRLCVYDDGSSDETAEVMKEFTSNDPRVEYFCHPSQIGSPANFQYGLKRIETPFFSFLSDDDYLLADFYKITLEGFQKYPNAIISAGSGIEINEKNQITNVALAGWENKEYFLPPDGFFQMVKNHLCWNSILFRKEVIEKVGLLDMDIEVIDTDFLFRITTSYPIAVSRKPCSVFVHHSSNYSGLIHKKLLWPGCLKVISNIKDNERIPRDIRIAVENAMRGYFRERLFAIGIKCIIKKEFTAAGDIANILEEHFQRINQPKLIQMLIKGCSKFSLLYWGINRTFELRNFLLRKKKRSLWDKEHLLIESKEHLL